MVQITDISTKYREIVRSIASGTIYFLAFDLIIASYRTTKSNMIQKIADGLFIGNREASKDVDQFSYVVNVTTDIPFSDGDKPCYRIPVFDIGVQSQQDIMFSHFFDICSNVDDQLKNGNVLVHCSEGKQRSCTVVVAYLMWKNKWNVDKSIKQLQNEHPLAFHDSTVHFLTSLKKWELILAAV